VEDELARQQLHVLKACLAKRSDAAALLGKLNEWLEAKNRGAVCAADTAYVTTKSKTSRRKRRTPLSGGNR
jgi:hypothetical protein